MLQKKTTAGLFNQPVDMPSSRYPKYREQSLSKVWVVLLSPEYVGVKTDRKSDSVEQRTQRAAFKRSSLSGYCSKLVSEAMSTIWVIIFCSSLPIYSQATYELSKNCSYGVELKRPLQNDGTCASETRVWERLSRRDVLGSQDPSALISFEMKSVLA